MLFMGSRYRSKILLKKPRSDLFMKVGLIRCMQTEDMCPMTTDFKIMREKKYAFENVEEDIEVIGVNTCGGCPGKKAVTRAVEMVKRGADTIVLASCITKGNPIGFACPHAEQMKQAIFNKIGDTVRLIDYTIKEYSLIIKVEQEHIISLLNTALFRNMFNTLY
jgi:predicted metal-binding protein